MQNKGYYAVQGHSKLSTLVPIESPYTTAYCLSTLLCCLLMQLEYSELSLSFIVSGRKIKHVFCVLIYLEQLMAYVVVCSIWHGLLMN